LSTVHLLVIVQNRQGINYKLPEDDTIVSKHVEGVDNCQLCTCWSLYKIGKVLTTSSLRMTQ